MIEFVVDSTAYVPKEYLKAHAISVVPLSLFLQGKEYIEGAHENYAQFYMDSAREKRIPTTSLPSTQAFIDSFEKILARGNEVICLTLSSTLSGTYNNARLAAQLTTNPSRVSVVDSGSIAQEIFFILQEMTELAESGNSREEIIARIEMLRAKVGLVFVPETLENLRKGGRMNLIASKMGDFLKIKPILQFQQGVLGCTKKIIGDVKAILSLVASIPKNAKKIGVLRVSNSVFFERLIENVQKRFKNIQIYACEVGPVVGAHIGRAYGLCWIC